MQIAQYKFRGALISYTGKAVVLNLHLSEQHAFSNTNSVPSKLRVCARAQRLQRLRTRKNLLRTDIFLHRHIVVDHKSTTINFTDSNTDRFWVKTFFFFGLRLILDTKTALVSDTKLWENSQKKCAHARTSAHREHKKLEETLNTKHNTTKLPNLAECRHY